MKNKVTINKRGRFSRNGMSAMATMYVHVTQFLVTSLNVSLALPATRLKLGCSLVPEGVKYNL